MNKCEIYFSEDDELSEFEIQGKCWRGDIIVKVGDKLFNPTVITPERLFLDFNNSIDAGRLFHVDENLILVKQTNKPTIIDTLIKLAQIGYFATIKPINLKQKYAHAFQEFQDLKNWVKVY